jgi:hypothetical protein
MLEELVVDTAQVDDLPWFDSLPRAKKIALSNALASISTKPYEIEHGEEGEIVIRTVEGGLKCFYLICMEGRNVRGTWIERGHLKTETWNANRRYSQPLMRWKSLLDSFTAGSREAL